LSEYEALRANPGVLEADLDTLPRSLIRARIAAGLSQHELAARLHLKEQQIQRYEATEYEGVSIDRIRDVCRALGVHVRNELMLPTEPRSIGQVLKKLQAVGLNKEFVLRRLLGAVPLAGAPETGIRKLSELLGRIYNWSPEQLVSSDPLSFENAILASVRYKSPGRAAAPLRNAYTIYAHYLSLLVLQCVKRVGTHPLPKSIDEVSRRLSALKGTHAELQLESVLEFVWSLGIPVLPLRDPGAFHGAWWRINGRDIIVVKQTTASVARWIIDILHEYFHAISEGEAPDAAVVEESDLFGPNLDSDVEQRATEFAVSVALEGRQEQLAEACVNAAHGKVEWLKTAVPQVAEREHVHVGMLANYLAYRLSFQNVNWWATAQNLQPEATDPWTIAARFIRDRIDVNVLAPLDRDLLMQALAEE
jgi:transcriptional regulator with XRE-family HTH domain